MTRTEAIILALDNLLNAIVNKSPDETFSAACYRKARRGKKRWVVLRTALDTIFFWDEGLDGKGHCHAAFINELNRRHLPVEYGGENDV